MNRTKPAAALLVAQVYLRASTDAQDLACHEGIIAAAKAAVYYVAGVYREKASGTRQTGPSCCTWWPTCNRVKWSLPRRSTASAVYRCPGPSAWWP